MEKESAYMVLLGSLTSFVVVLFTMPSLIKVARLKHLVDEPTEERKLHSRSIPTIGGIIIFAAIIFSYSIWFPLQGPFGPFTGSGECMGQCGSYKLFKFVIAAMVLLFFLGVKDDIIGFSPVKKLVGHVIVGYILVVMGDVRIRDMHGIFGVYGVSNEISIALSFFTYVVMVNAFNLIDGVDGLAGGIGLISALTYGFWLFWAGDVALAMLAFVLAGALLGFLVFNFHPARIFMGDSGSLIIGAILSVLAMRVVDHDTRQLPDWLRLVPTPLFAMATVAYPLVDTLRIFIVRTARGVSPFNADKNHIHHRLMALGLGHRGTTGMLYLYSALMIALCLVTRDVKPNQGLLILGAAAVLLAMLPFAVPLRKAA